MRAAQIRQAGAPPQVTTLPTPKKGEEQAVISVLAAAITPLDLLISGGDSYFGAPPYPYIPGVQGVGIVESSEHHRRGTTVWFSTSAGINNDDGAMAEVARVHHDRLVPIDETVPPDLVVALGLSAVAAYRSLFDAARFMPGNSVLVLGASGVVGSCAIQLAHHHGASVVIGAGRRAGSEEHALANGAHGWVDLRVPQSTTEYVDAYKKLCPDGFDIVIDPLCGVPGSAAISALKPGGRLVNLGSSAGPQATFESAEVRSRELAIVGYTNASVAPQALSATLGVIVELAKEGQLKIVRELYPLEDVGDAWSSMAKGAAKGRSVVVTKRFTEQ